MPKRGSSALSPFGRQLRHWRHLRGVSQLELANRAGASPRHISFLETGRSRPTGPTVLRLADTLDVPLRDRNRLLEAAGLPPSYPERDLSADEMVPVRKVIAHMLRSHEPFPAFGIDRWWNIVAANGPARSFLPGFDSQDPPNGVELTFGPGPWRQVLSNWPEVAWASFARLRREVAEAPQDARLLELLRTASGHLEGVAQPTLELADNPPLICPVLKIGDRNIPMISTIARFGTAHDVTANELRIELLFPADDEAEAFFVEAFEG